MPKLIHAALAACNYAKASGTEAALAGAATLAHCSCRNPVAVAVKAVIRPARRLHPARRVVSVRSAVVRHIPGGDL
jgi:hypothetical protein